MRALMPSRTRPNMSLEERSALLRRRNDSLLEYARFQVATMPMPVEVLIHYDHGTPVQQSLSVMGSVLDAIEWDSWHRSWWAYIYNTHLKMRNWGWDGILR